MSEHGLTPDEIKQKHSEGIAIPSTFKTHGVSEEAARAYLLTPEGGRMLDSLVQGDSTAPTSEIRRRAIGLLTSGRDLPRLEVINEPLVKIVPAGEPLNQTTPYFAKLSEFEQALSQGHSLNDRFGLPVRNEAAIYDVYRIEPKGPTEVFVSEVAPTSELNGQVRHAGGAQQYLVPNRSLFTEGARITSLGNDLALHNELVVGNGLGNPIAALGRSAMTAEATAARGLRPATGAAAKSLGALGALASAHDMADAAHDVGRLRAQGNATAAEDRITRFATQNLGGWGGAAAGFGIGAAAGVETGPGLLVTGAVGGIIGAVGGDKLADWIRDRKINHQEDAQGNTWTFDPDQPARGWTRENGTLVDQALGRSRTPADPVLADELNWKASSKSIELALGSPPQNRDPYRLPPNAAEQAQRTPFEQDRALVRDPQTGQWRQEITELHDGRLRMTRHEPVDPARATELEQTSQEIIARNALNTPAAMAARFQAIYEQNGWSRYGPVPAAVDEAMGHPGRVVGSDGRLYERDASGQWTHDGLFWDGRAGGTLHRELEATYQQQLQQRDIKTLDTVTVRPGPDVGRDQAAAIALTPTGAIGAPDNASGAANKRSASRSPADEGHPDHGMLQRIRAGVAEFDRNAGKPWDETSERLSRALLAACKDDGRESRDPDGGNSLSANALQRVDHMAMSTDGRRAFAVQGGKDDPAHRLAAVEVERAIRTPVEASDAQLERANARIAEELERARQQELARSQSLEDPNRGLAR